jgi:hypothetical protein
VQKLLDELGLRLRLLDAAKKGEWHNITRPLAEAPAARAASRFPAQVAAQRPSQAAVIKGAALSTSRAALAAGASDSGSESVTSETCKPESGPGET